MLALGLMVTAMYSNLELMQSASSLNSTTQGDDASGSASNFKERCKNNVLQLFQYMQQGRSSTGIRVNGRETELLLRFLP